LFIEMIEKRVCDGGILRLIGKWINVGVIGDGRLLISETGTGQGQVISPLLANIYLHYVLDEWFETVVKSRLKGEAYEIRFADDTTGTSSTRPKRIPSLPLPPLVCRNKSGARYERPAHIQAELRSIVPLDPSEWIGRIGSFQNETLVCLIRLTHDGNPDLCGILIKELRNRINHRALKFCDKMDDYDKEQFSSDVDIQVLNLVLTKQPSTEGEILEIAFGRTLQNLARNQLKKFKRSVAGNLVDFSVEYTDVDGADEREGIERLKFLPATLLRPYRRAQPATNLN
jgi:hypothetical protein